MASRLQYLEGELDQRRTAGGARAAGLEASSDARREGFDATSYAREASRAAFDDYRRDFDRGIEGLRGQQVGMGRLRTGFATEDEDRLGEDMNRRLAQELSRNAFMAASLDLQNTEGIGRAGTEARAGSDAALAGGLDRAQAAENERRQRRSRFLGVLAGGAGAAIGGLAGGPAGAALGARLGSQLGG